MVMAMALLAISSGIKGSPSKVKTRLKALSKVPERGARNPPRAARFGGRLAMGRAAVAAAAAAAAEAQRGGSPRRAARHTSGVAEAPSGRRKREEE